MGDDQDADEDRNTNEDNALQINITVVISLADIR